jgi:ATP-dependent DNA helicase RecG
MFQFSRGLIATTDGKVLRRRLKADGSPETLPLYPHEFGQRLSSIGALDPSAAIVSDAIIDDLDPVERQRLRSLIERYRGDPSLLPLSDEELDGALGMVRVEGGERKPTLAGLILLGKDDSISRLIPSHQVAFQVLDRGDVKVNDFSREPLARLFDRLIERFDARNEETELIPEGLFRISVPAFDRRAFREGVVNALVHRDYGKIGAVHIRFEDDALIISNPGGFVEGVRRDNLLVVEPRPRNPLLADVFKRIGLAERTGRGVDLIYEGLLRYGRNAPDYSRSDGAGVVLEMTSTEPDIAFISLLLDEEKRSGMRISLESLLVLSAIREERRLGIHDLAEYSQRGETKARATVERLVEAGLVDAHGAATKREYTLSAHLYSKIGDKAAIIRQAGFEPLQQREMVVSYIKKHARITRSEVMTLCKVSSRDAESLLKRLAREGTIKLHGERRGSYYTL